MEICASSTHLFSYSFFPTSRTLNTGQTSNKQRDFIRKDQSFHSAILGAYSSLQWDYSNRGTWKKIIQSQHFFENTENILKFFFFLQTEQ